MAAAAGLLEGTHDFAGFQSAGSNVPTTVRTMSASRIVERGPGLVTYEITGDGFLRHMVRSIVGTLVEIGRGRWAPSRIEQVLSSGDRARAGPTAPPEGLFLVSVEYGAL
jgi:tRNA pseudouridine38-40 synthase